MAITGVVAVGRARREDETRPGASAGQPPYLLYYKAELDTAKLRALELEADVISRDLDSVEHQLTEAGEGRFEIDAVDDWLAGRPTYALVGELATCEVLSGELPRPEFPAALRRPRRAAGARPPPAPSSRRIARVAGRRRRLRGQLAKAAVAMAQARIAEQGEWVLGEAGIVRRAGLVGPRRSWRRPATGPTSSSARLPGCESPWE